MSTFTLIFLITLAFGTGLQLWLSFRQSRHVKQHQKQVPDAFAQSISLEDHQKAARYTQTRLKLSQLKLVIAPMVLLAWTLGGGLALLDASLLSLDFSLLWQGVLLLLAVMLIEALIDLPLDAYSTFNIEKRFGFNRSTLGRFVKDKLLGLVLMLVLGLPLLIGVLWIMQSAGNYWWVWAWGLWMAFSLLVTWAYPIWIAPIFNKFKPLESGPLRERLEQLLSRCGFQSDGMFVMDGSQRSSHGNAYFTGFGKNKRIVFFDTLLEGLSDEQVEAVLAHELGHFKRKHVQKMLLTSAGLSLIGLGLLGWLAEQAWFYSSLGIDRSSPALALTLFMLVLPVFSVLLSPIMSMLSRKHEYEADDFAAEQTHPKHLIEGLVSMYRDNASTLTPDPIYSAFYHSHPPAPLRVAHLSRKL